MSVRRKNNKWCADFYIEGERLRIAAPTKEMAEQIVITSKADALRGRFRLKKHTTVPTLAQFSIRYMQYAITNKRSWKRDQVSIKNLEREFSNVRLDQITAFRIEQYKQERLEKVSAATVNRELACLKYMISLAVEWDLISKNPVKGIKMLKEDEREPFILDSEQEKRLLECCTDHIRPIVQVALNTGMRLNEILQLRWKDVDFDNVAITIREKVAKSGKSRTIPINNTLKLVLRSLPRTGAYVFGGDKPYGSVQTSFKLAIKKAGLDGLWFHDLRHTFATRLAANGVDIITIQNLLGHHSVVLTQRYCQPLAENKRLALNILDKKTDQIIPFTEKSGHYLDTKAN